MNRSNLFRTLVAAAMTTAFASSTLAVAAYAADPSESNKGGAVRGTARADERAGAHGDQGRDRAEANKTTKTADKNTKSKGSKPTTPGSK